MQERREAMRTFLQLLYRFFRSTKLAIVLIICGIMLAAAGTLIPQQLHSSYYLSTYPDSISALILNLGLDNLQRSPLTLVPALLFSLNLLACTVSRIFTRVNNHAKRRFGPDLIHTALLLMLIGGAVSTFGRTEEFFTAAAGEIITPNGIELTIDSLQAATYEDGSIRNFTTAFHAPRGPEMQAAVNHPVKIGKGMLYQYDYAIDDRVTLQGGEGAMIYLSAGDLLELEGSFYRYIGNLTGDAADSARFRNLSDSSAELLELELKGTIGEFSIEEIDYKLVTTLKYTEDPGVRAVFFALLLFIGGMVLTLYQKAKDLNV